MRHATHKSLLLWLATARAVAVADAPRAAVAASELAREAPTLPRPDAHGAPISAPRAPSKGFAVVVDPLCDYLGKALVEELRDRGVAVATTLSDYAAAGAPPATMSGVWRSRVASPPRGRRGPPRTDASPWVAATPRLVGD